MGNLVLGVVNFVVIQLACVPPLRENGANRDRNTVITKHALSLSMLTQDRGILRNRPDKTNTIIKRPSRGAITEPLNANITVESVRRFKT